MICWMNDLLTMGKKTEEDQLLQLWSSSHACRYTVGRSLMVTSTIRVVLFIPFLSTKAHAYFYQQGCVCHHHSLTIILRVHSIISTVHKSTYDVAISIKKHHSTTWNPQRWSLGLFYLCNQSSLCWSLQNLRCDVSFDLMQSQSSSIYLLPVYWLVIILVGQVWSPTMTFDDKNLPSSYHWFSLNAFFDMWKQSKGKGVAGENCFHSWDNSYSTTVASQSNSPYLPTQLTFPPPPPYIHKYPNTVEASNQLSQYDDLWFAKFPSFTGLLLCESRQWYH